MNLIAIEASTEMCSVGLLHQNQISHRSEIAPQKHAELILGHIDELLNAQGLNKTALDGLVLGHGPGAFTGVRIGLAIVQGLALALELPVLPISTMHNMAQQLHQNPAVPAGRYLLANDARMGEVYWAAFSSDGDCLERLCEDQLAKPAAVPWINYDGAAGSALKALIQVDDGYWVDSSLLPNASALLELAQAEPIEHFKPITDIQPQYIREQVVQS